MVRFALCHPDRPYYAKDQCQSCYYNKTGVRKSHLWELYGITEDQYLAILEEQNGRCVICGALPEKKRLHVDHDHDTGKIRGLLCHRCNVGLGHFMDEPSLLRKAAAYLER